MNRVFSGRFDKRWNEDSFPTVKPVAESATKLLIVMTIEQTTSALAVLIGSTLLNIWLLRVNRPTSYRGGNAKTMREEFRQYGLPEAMFYIVGAVKIGLALVLIASIWLPQLLQPAAMVLAALMLCAVGMHIKVSDPVRKAVPALFLFCLSIFLAVVDSV